MNRSIIRLVIIICGVFLLQITMLGARTDGDESKDRAALSKLQQVALAMHLFHGSHDSFPAHASYKNGKALLSWRVHLLPFLGEKALYEQFRLDEAWDSPHNKKLIAKTPKVYSDSLDEVDKSGKTRFLAPLGLPNVFTGKPTGVRSSDITDGLGKTVIVVEVTAERAVVWTKPDDLAVDTTEPATGLLEEGKDSFNVALADGRARRIPKTTLSKELRAMFTCNGSD